MQAIKLRGVEVNNLQKISLDIPLRQTIVFCGVSGSGKTSLVEVISGLSSCQKGEIKWLNKSLNARQRRWLCGLVFQFPERYFLGLTIAQELRLGKLYR